MPAQNAAPATRPDAEAGSHVDTETAAIVRRLKSAEGHVRGIARMVEEGAYCIDVLNQLVAVQRALQKTGERVLERHLRSCATTAIRGDRPEERERVIEEIIDVFSAMGRT